MTQPFKPKTDEKVDVELKVGSEGPASPPAVIDTQEQSAPPPADHTPAKESTAPAAGSASSLKPARPKKELNLPATVLGMTVLSVLPIIIFGFSLLVDPEAMPYLQGRLTASNQQNAITHFSNAFAAHNNVEILDDRQRAYTWNGKYDLATIDRQILVDHNVGNAKPYRSVAISRIRDNGVSETSLAMLRKSAALSRDHLNQFWLDLGMDSHNLYLCSYDLLACNDSRTAQELSTLTTQKGFKPYETALLRALALRETGHSADALKVLNAIQQTDGRHGTSRSTKDYFKVLCDLDLHATGNARKSWLAANDYTGIQNTGLRYLTGAWLSFQEGDLDRAFTMASKADEEFQRDEQQSIADVQAEAALQRLRELISQKRAGTQIAPRAFKDKNLNGWMFTPKPYRTPPQ
ncbi:MAG: hypothetical protein JST01_08530 [Cyanobacteria bacterium SZAS TMP-1]|nr:hypothetical protein [Cyanobacteria bacterium SZAS TMP-1]